MKKYRPTILNITAIILIVYNLFIGDWDNWGGVAKITLIGIGILGLLIDFGIQKIAKKYLLINLIEFLILIGIYFFNAWQERELIITVPDSFRGEIILIYGVRESDKLEIDLLTQNYRISNINNRIIATSTVLDNNVPKTKFITQSGQELYIQPDTTKVHLEVIKMDKYNCNNGEWDYTIWLIRQNELYEKERIILDTKLSLNEICEGK